MEDLLLLKNIMFFQGLNSRELGEISKIATNVSFKKGQKIFDEGSACDAIYVIKSGSVVVKSKNIVVAQLENGEPVGEMSFIDKGERSASVTAVEDTLLIRVSADSFHNLLEKEFEMAAKIYKVIAVTLCHRLRETGDFINLRLKLSEAELKRILMRASAGGSN